METRPTLQLVRMGSDDRIGTELGGYRIVEQLGSGGTSVVYRAEHVRLGRPAALKLLMPGFGEADFRGRFMRESQLAASLDHPSIVPVYDAGEENGFLYIAMACIDGVDLKTLLAEEERLDVRRALRILGQIGSALDAAHARGLVHRDVKPANILVGEGDRAYLSDFGVVKELAGNGTTRTGSFIGTIEYCAPEQIEGQDVDGRADVYALACVLYESVTGEPPFHRPSEVAVLNAHLHTPPPKLSRAAPDLPAALEPVISKALSKSPLDRYATCGELIAAARSAAAERRVHRLRLAASILLLVLAGLLGAAIAFGAVLLFRDSPAPRVETVVRTPPTPVSLDTLLLQSEDGRTLNDAAYYLIRGGQYSRAVPFAQKAVRYATRGSVVRGYATFNLGLALLKSGRCGEALPYLRRALRMEAKAQQPYIRPVITQARSCARRGGAEQALFPSSGGPQDSSRGR